MRILILFNPIAGKGKSRAVARRVDERLRAAGHETAVAETRVSYTIVQSDIPKDDILRLIKDLESQMKHAARNLEFEKAALLRDQIGDLRKVVVD